MNDNPVQHELKKPVSFFHRAAGYAVWALVGAFVVNVIGIGVPGAGPKQIVSILCGVIMLSAIPAGIVALAGIPKHGKQRLLWKGLVGVCVPILLIGLAIPAFLTVRRVSLEKATGNMAKEIARSINEKMSTMIDDVTRLDGADVGPEKTVTIRATITSLDAQQVDRESWKTKVVPTIRAGVENSDIMGFVRRGGTLIYKYSGRDGAFIDEVVFNPSDYSAGDAGRTSR